MAESSDPKSPPSAVSPGGSVIHRHDELSPPQIGLPGKAAAGFAEARKEAYGRLFGEAASVSHEVLPLIPHIDVFTFYRRNQGRDICTLVTGGMSDLEMEVPDSPGVPKRVELIFYCLEPAPEYIATLRWLAHFPHDQKTWLGFWHTLPNGNPPAPFWGSSILDTILFMPTIVQCDARLPEELKLDGEPVDFLWVVPLSTPECDLKLEKGVDAVLELFEQHQHPHVFDPHRKSYV